MSSPRQRYALYYAPDSATALWTVGCAWLGRDAETGEKLPPPEIPDLPAELIERITLAPAQYGLHATLKPPFELAGGCTEDALLEAVSAFAERQSPIVVPGLCVGQLGPFLALVPTAPLLSLNRLAADCVRDFDAFRAPPDKAVLEKRLFASLTGRQRDLLMRWGYPYVMEEFRFHITLTGAPPEADADAIRAALSDLFCRVTGSPLSVAALSVFVQPAETAPFRVLARFPFGLG